MKNLVWITLIALCYLSGCEVVNYTYTLKGIITNPQGQALSGTQGDLCVTAYLNTRGGAVVRQCRPLIADQEGRFQVRYSADKNYLLGKVPDFKANEVMIMANLVYLGKTIPVKTISGRKFKLTGSEALPSPPEEILVENPHRSAEGLGNELVRFVGALEIKNKTSVAQKNINNNIEIQQFLRQNLNHISPLDCIRLADYSSDNKFTSWILGQCQSHLASRHGSSSFEVSILGAMIKKLQESNRIQASAALHSVLEDQRKADDKADFWMNIGLGLAGD